VKRALRIAGYGLFLVVIVAMGSELFLRYLHPETSGYHIWPPHYQADFVPSDRATPGIQGVGRFRVNSLGLRSDEPPPDRRRTVYVLGGSTAIDVYLDQDEAWAQLLQDRLNAPGDPKTWVGNLSRSSLATLHNLLIFDHLLPELPPPDLFVNLLGVNDLQLALKSSFLADMTTETHLRWTFAELPSNGPWWERLATVRFYRRVADWQARARIGTVQSFNADGFITWRQCRQTAPHERMVDQLPDLTAALAQFRVNLLELADRASRQGATMMFLTQPTIYAPVMDPADVAVLIAGGLGPNTDWCKRQEYFTPRALAEGVDRFNAVTLEVCRERGLPCVDLAAAVAKSRVNFYDDMHFNEAGARRVAEVVAPAVRAWFDQHPPTGRGAPRP
jgi:lysophospholipase L1-like esterase